MLKNAHDQYASKFNKCATQSPRQYAGPKQILNNVEVVVVSGKHEPKSKKIT